MNQKFPNLKKQLYLKWLMFPEWCETILKTLESLTTLAKYKTQSHSTCWKVPPHLSCHISVPLTSIEISPG